MNRVNCLHPPVFRLHLKVILYVHANDLPQFLSAFCEVTLSQVYYSLVVLAVERSEISFRG